MPLDFNTPRELKTTMIPYVKEIVELFSQYDNSKFTAATPAAKHLFKVNEDAASSEDAIFHWRFETRCKCRIIPLIPGIT